MPYHSLFVNEKATMNTNHLLTQSIPKLQQVYIIYIIKMQIINKPKNNPKEWIITNNCKLKIITLNNSHFETINQK